MTTPTPKAMSDEHLASLLAYAPDSFDLREAYHDLIADALAQRELVAKLQTELNLMRSRLYMDMSSYQYFSATPPPAKCSACKGFGWEHDIKGDRKGKCLYCGGTGAEPAVARSVDGVPLIVDNSTKMVPK